MQKEVFFSRSYIIPLLLVMVPIPASNSKTIDITATSIASIAIASVHSYSAIGGRYRNSHKRGSAIYFVPTGSSK